jgi:O-antigen ligase
MLIRRWLSYMPVVLAGGFLLLLATGAYVLQPGSGYIFVAGVGAYLVARAGSQAAWSDYFPARMVGGAIVINIVFCAWAWLDALEARAYLIHVMSMTVFLLGYGLGRDALARGVLAPFQTAFAVAGLSVLLAGQVGEVAGYFAFVPEGTVPPQTFFDRPGGFQNSNMTAALALCLVFLARPLSAGTGMWARIASLVLGGAVVLLTQSRAALLVCGLVAAWLVLMRPRLWPMCGALLLLVLLALNFTEEGAELAARILLRLEGDESSDDRRYLVRVAIEQITAAPWFGSGYGSVERVAGNGSHVQPLETLASFGVVGSVLIATAVIAMLAPCSAAFLLVCVAPTLLFSHNFFESVPFQAAIGLALGVDRAFRRAARDRVAGYVEGEAHHLPGLRAGSAAER